MALANKKSNTVHSKSGSDKVKLKDEFDNGYLDKIATNPDEEPAFASIIYQLGLIQEDVDELRRFSNTELNHKNSSKMILNCGWYGGSTARQYLPFGYGGTFEATSPNGYLEYGGFVAPCNGSVESVIIRSENACGNSNVGIHFANNNTEVPNFNPGSGVSDTVNMSADDTSYKFLSFDGQYASNLNTFTAGQVIFISFDPTNASMDSIATMVLNLDWTNSL